MAITVILIAGLLFMLKFFKVKIMEPAGIYSTVWLFFIIGSVLFLRGEYEFKYSGIIWILITCYLFVIISRLVSSKEKCLVYRTIQRPCIPWKILIFIVIMSMGSVLYTMITAGVSFSVFSDFMSLQNTAHMAAVHRYSSNGEGGSLVGQILGSFIYISPICCGYSYIFAKEKKEKLICFSSILPSIFSMLLTSAKLSLIAFVMLFFIGFYVAYIFNKKNVPKLKTKILVFLFGSALALYALFFLSFVLRIGSGEQNISKVISTKLMIYAFGHIQGFDIWFAENAFKLEDYGIFKNTFLAISSKLGMSVKNQGVYGLIPGICTNVFTQFRSLIEDLGPVFAMIMLVIVFLEVYLLFYKLISGKKAFVIEQTMLAASFYWLIYFIVSAWTYTTYLLTFVVFGLFLYISFHVKFVWGNRK